MFLAIVMICGVGLLIYPYASTLPVTETSNLTLMPTTAHINANAWFYGAVFLNLLSILLAAITIFLFKNRKLQIKITYFLIFINFLLFAALYFSNSPNNLSAILIPAIAIASAYMAIRYIKKDDALVRSADRIR